MNLGQTIKQQRIERGFTQKSFANLCSISQTYLSQIENERREPNISTLKVIATQLGVPLPILFFLSLDAEDIPNPEKRKIFEDLGTPLKQFISLPISQKQEIPIKRKGHLESILGHSFAELTEITNNIKEYYKPYVKKETKPDGSIKEREISPAVEALESIQDKIRKQILTKIPMPDYIVGGRKGRDSASNALHHKGNKYKLCTDLSNYFPSITNKIVYDMFIKNGFSPDVSSMLTKLTTFQGKVPQGAKTSSDIANLVFVPYDKKIHRYCCDHEITYTRYIDDLTFSSPKDFQDKSMEILQFIFDSPFKINNKKTFYTAGKAIITGVLTGQNNLTTTKKFKEKFEKTTSQNSRDGMTTFENHVKKTGLKKRKRLFMK